MVDIRLQKYNRGTSYCLDYLSENVQGDICTSISYFFSKYRQCNDISPENNILQKTVLTQINKSTKEKFFIYWSKTTFPKWLVDIHSVLWNCFILILLHLSSTKRIILSVIWISYTCTFWDLSHSSEYYEYIKYVLLIIPLYVSKMVDSIVWGVCITVVWYDALVIDWVWWKYFQSDRVYIHTLVSDKYVRKVDVLPYFFIYNFEQYTPTIVWPVLLKDAQNTIRYTEI